MAGETAAASNGTRATPQGGVLEGVNPIVYSAANPINTLIIQAGIIIIFCRLLHYPLSKVRQPRVIAEVLGGVLLGPSVMGRIPGFTAAIFPTASMPTLNAAANIGLILFLFLVGLEADFRYLASNWRVALSVGALGMILPFALGVAIATGLYSTFNSEPGVKPVGFGIFLLFVGVAMAITAFPVLCRILTELKLLRTKVGVIVLSAGVGNDLVGWVLLALCVALVNAGSGIAALYIILISVAYCLFLFFAVRPAFVWVLRRSGSFENGPSQSIVALTVLMVLASAFFTGVIGVHPMFGGFMIGLICPHDGGFAVKLTEKIEDLVSVLLLPLYFALSGLNTNLALLNTGIIWAYVIGVLAIAFFGKIVGGTLAARFNGMVWRESLTIGTLMSCKGLVELIVLNIGLQANILSKATFTMFVVMALVTTFATTPLVSVLYPHWYQVKLEAWKRGEIDWDTGNPISTEDRPSSYVFSKSEKHEVSKIMAYLRLDSLPGMLTLVSLLAQPVNEKATVHPSKTQEAEEKEEDATLSSSVMRRFLKLHGVRLTALTDRDSSVMRVADIDESANRDPVLKTLTAFGQAKSLSVSGDMLLGPEDTFAQSLTDRAADVDAEMVLLPWSESGAMSEFPSEVPSGPRDRFADGTFSDFIATTVRGSSCPVGVFIDNGFGTTKIPQRPFMSRTVSVLSERQTYLPSFPAIAQGHHVFFPYFGSEDDRVALRFVLQVVRDPSITATIVHIESPMHGSKDARTSTLEVARSGSLNSPDESGNEGQVVQVATGLSAAQTGPTGRDYASFFATLRDSLPSEVESRVLFKTVSASDIHSQVLEMASEEMRSVTKNAGNMVVLGRNSNLDLGSGQEVFESVAKGMLGDLAGSIVGSGIRASLLVIHDSNN